MGNVEVATFKDGGGHHHQKDVEDCHDEVVERDVDEGCKESLSCDGCFVELLLLLGECVGIAVAVIVLKLSWNLWNWKYSLVHLVYEMQ